MAVPCQRKHTPRGRDRLINGIPHGNRTSYGCESRSEADRLCASRGASFGLPGATVQVVGDGEHFSFFLCFSLFF